MRPAWVHAYVATVTEIGSGVLLLLGLLTPLAAAGVLGTMLVALVTAHIKNGFFIFRPGQGYEYVLMICVVAVALAGTGAGWLSLDHVAGYPISGWAAYAVCAGLGGLGAAPHAPHLLAPGPCGSRAGRHRGRRRGLTRPAGPVGGGPGMPRQIKPIISNGP